MPGRKLGYKSSGTTRRNVKAEYFCRWLKGEYNVIVNDQRWELRDVMHGAKPGVGIAWPCSRLSLTFFRHNRWHRFPTMDKFLGCSFTSIVAFTLSRAQDGPKVASPFLSRLKLAAS